MTITIRLTKVEVEMLKGLQKKDKRHKKGLEEKVKKEIQQDLSLREIKTQLHHCHQCHNRKIITILHHPVFAFHVT